MANYIDKAALVAEIDNLLDKCKYHEEYDCAYRDGNNGALYALKGKLDTLEVKEVDLDFMLHEYWNLFPKITIDCLESATMTKDEMINFAKHFFELGLKARKAVEIAREEELKYIKYQLDLRLPETLDYNGVQVDREDFINDFVKAMKDE